MRHAEGLELCIRAASVLGEFPVMCVHSHYVQYRYDVREKTNAFFPSLSQMGNDSLASGDLERGSAGRSICMGPSVNT